MLTEMFSPKVFYFVGLAAFPDLTWNHIKMVLGQPWASKAGRDTNTYYSTGKGKNMKKKERKGSS